MPSNKRLLAIAMTLPISLSAGCAHTVIQNDVPPCERLIHPSLLQPVPPADQPVSAKLPDGHDDARPWQIGFIRQTGQLEKQFLNTEAVDWSYRECLKMHREAAAKVTRRRFLGLF